MVPSQRLRSHRLMYGPSGADWPQPPLRPLVSGWPLSRLELRLRAWWLCRRQRQPHPVASLIARGDWATLDRLLAELDAS